MATSKSKITSEQEKWLRFHDGQYQFQAPFMLDADFKSILKPVDEECREKMNKMYWLNDVYTAHLHMKMFLTHSKCTVVKTCREVYRAYWRLRYIGCMQHFHNNQWQSLLMYWKGSMNLQKTVICYKEFSDSKNRKVRNYCHYTILYWEAAHNNCNLKY